MGLYILLVFMFVWVCFIGIPTDQAVYLDGIGAFFVAQVGMKPTKWGDEILVGFGYYCIHSMYIIYWLQCVYNILVYK